MKPLYVVGTQRDVGKTTFCIGLISALRERGLRVGYTKPLGQRITTVEGRAIHDDALVVSQVMNMQDPESAAVPLTRGRVEKEILDLRVPDLAEKVSAVCRRLADQNDVVVIEGMGNVATGSCLQLSAADVGRIVGARSLLIAGGGIGRTIDEIALCATFLEARQAHLMGAVVNKVWAEKYQRVHDATTQGLANLGIRSFGTVPYEQVLACPTMRQVAEQLNAEVLCGADGLGNRVVNTIVAAVEPHHLLSFLKDRTLVIAPGDRSDNILVVVTTHALASPAHAALAGIVLTCGFHPPEEVMGLMAASGLPALLCPDDTCTIATKLRQMVFKITPDDHERIEAAKCLVTDYIDVDGLVAGLQE